MKELKSVYDTLPENEKKNCFIWGKHYSQAGAVELFRNDYGLPHAFSYHGSFYSWASKSKIPEIVIAYCYNDANINFFTPFFEEVITVRKICSNYASQEGWAEQTIFICKKTRPDFDAMEKLFEKRIFE